VGPRQTTPALKGIAHAKRDKGNHIITSSVEHHSVSETAAALKKEGFRITYLPVDEYGMVDPDDVKKAIDEKTILISVMHANNEIGRYNRSPRSERLPASGGSPSIPTPSRASGIYRSMSTNWALICCPPLPISSTDQGVRVFCSCEKAQKLVSLLSGGDQERRRRAGTTIPPGSWYRDRGHTGHVSMAEESVREAGLRDRLIKELTGAIEDTNLNGHPTTRLPNNTNISFHFIEGESILLSLDMEGIAASTGSACTSSTLEPSSRASGYRAFP